MSAHPPPLVDFLLARILEDEKTGGDPTRVPDQCAARRRIVEYAAAASRAGGGVIWPPAVHMAGMADGLGLALRALAEPYRLHPDYQREWRP